MTVDGRHGGCAGWSAAVGVGSLEAGRPRLLPSRSRSGAGDGSIYGCVQQCLDGLWEVVRWVMEHGGRPGRSRASAAPPPHPLPCWLCGGRAQQGGEWWHEGRHWRPDSVVATRRMHIRGFGGATTVNCVKVVGGAMGRKTWA
jgi:hypothetical protein